MNTGSKDTGKAARFRRSRLTDVLWGIATVALVVGIIGSIVWTVVSIPGDVVKKQELRAHGVQTSAVVINTWQGFFARDYGLAGVSHNVSYRFEYTDGDGGTNTYTQSGIEVSPGAFSQLAIGGEIPVYYLASDPAINVPASEIDSLARDVHRTARLIILFTMWIIMCVGIVIVYNRLAPKLKKYRSRKSKVDVPVIFLLGSVTAALLISYALSFPLMDMIEKAVM